VLCQLWCRVVSIMCSARPSTCFTTAKLCLTTVFELKLLFTVRLSSCYYSSYCISHFVSNNFLLYHEKIAPPAPPLARARGCTPPSKFIPARNNPDVQELVGAFPSAFSQESSSALHSELSVFFGICAEGTQTNGRKTSVATHQVLRQNR
jgi:hypothetical protein